MKKTILLIAVVLAAGVVSGQKTFTFGPKVGINIADLYASSAENTRDLNGTKPSLIVGAFAEYRALKWLAVSADVLYSRQGSTDKATWTERGPGGGFVTESEEFSYAQLPEHSDPGQLYARRTGPEARHQQDSSSVPNCGCAATTDVGKPPTSKTKTCSGRPTSPFPSASPIPSTADW